MKVKFISSKFPSGKQKQEFSRFVDEI